MAGAVEIRKLFESDIPAAMRVKEAAGWNQTEADWRRLLKIEPDGCFAGCVDGKVVATTTTTRYGSVLAWIGMVLVDPEYRRQGIAKALMNEALEYLTRTRTRTIKLDATPAGRPLYESLGFKLEGLVERWAASPPKPAASLSPGRLSESLEADLVWALDRAAFGADRIALLETLVADASVPPLMSYTPRGDLKGYALARRGTAASYLGPVIARDSATGLALLDGLLGRLEGAKVYLDFYTGFPCSPAELAARGFQKQRDLFRMGLGEPTAAGTSELVLGIAGPEIG